MRRKYGKQSAPDTGQATEFNFGYFYRTLEEHVNAFAAQEGCPYPVADVALRVGRLLQSKALREQLRDSELVPEVRQNGAGLGVRGATESGAEVHVRARRILSLKARRAIGRAQRERWARFHAGQAPQPNAKKAKETIEEKRERWRREKQAERARLARGKRLKVGQTKNPSKAMKGFWASMTPAQRSAEMVRRRQVAAAKKAGRAAKKPVVLSAKVKRGFWQHEVRRLLMNPRPQREVSDALRRRFPEKAAGVAVAIAAMKRNKQLIEVNGLLALAQSVNGAAQASA